MTKKLYQRNNDADSISEDLACLDGRLKLRPWGTYINCKQKRTSEIKDKCIILQSNL
jgi:hypothetical protein